MVYLFMPNSLFIIGVPEGVEWIFLVVGVIMFIYWITTLWELLNTRFEESAVKFFWLIVVFVTGIFGAAIYRIFGRPKAIKSM